MPGPGNWASERRYRCSGSGLQLVVRKKSVGFCWEGAFPDGVVSVVGPDQVEPGQHHKAAAGGQAGRDEHQRRPVQVRGREREHQGGGNVEAGAGSRAPEHVEDLPFNGKVACPQNGVEPEAGQEGCQRAQE